MLKKILLVLDPSDAGVAARHCALHLAEKYGAFLTALGILDTPWITAAQPEPLGGSIFKIQRDEEIIQQSHQHIQKLLDDFRQEAEAQKLQSMILEGEGFPSVVIERLSHEHDLIVIGKTTDIHFDLDDESDLIVRHVARDNPRPVLIVPKTYHEGKGVLVAYDGSLGASRALHMFLLLGLGQDQSLEIMCVNKDVAMAEKIAARGVRMCQSHGVSATAFIIEDERHTSDHILERATAMDAGMICLGGFSHSALKDALFGSTTKSLLRDVTIPMFVHH